MKKSQVRNNRILYCILLFSSLIFIGSYGGFVPYTLFYIVVFLPVISLVFTIIIYVRLKYIQSLDKKFVVKGDKVSFKYTVANEDIIFYPYIKTTFYTTGSLILNNKNSISFSLPPLSSRKLSIKLNTRYRGKYKIGIKSIEIQDFLGLFSLKYKVFEPREITIYPRIIHLDRFRLIKDYLSEIDYTEMSAAEDMLNINDIRKYLYGDSIKKIHWKLTAKHDELMVKNFYSTSEMSIDLILDLYIDATYAGDTKAAVEDCIIESVISIADYCIRKFVPINLAYYEEGIRQEMTKNANEFASFYNLLARIKFDSKIDLSKVLNIYLRNNINKKNIIIFTSNLNTSLLEVLSKASQIGYSVKVIFVNDGNYKINNDMDITNIKSNLMSIGIELFTLGIDDNIKSVLEANIPASVQNIIKSE